MTRGRPKQIDSCGVQHSFAVLGQSWEGEYDANSLHKLILKGKFFQTRICCAIVCGRGGILRLFVRPVRLMYNVSKVA